MRVNAEKPGRQNASQGQALSRTDDLNYEGTASGSLVIDKAARQIAEFVNKYPRKSVRLLGYSTGGPIVIEATKYIQAFDIKVAAISPAAEKAGGLSTLLGSARDLIGATLRAGSINRELVWMEYYRTLLYGRRGRKDPNFAGEIARLVEQEKDNIVLPTAKLTEAHTQDLRRWKVSNSLVLDVNNVAIYIGKEDPVFSPRQIRALAEKLGVTRVFEYDNAGHLLFLTHPEVFDDIFKFFQPFR